MHLGVLKALESEENRYLFKGSAEVCSLITGQGRVSEVSMGDNMEVDESCGSRT
jgi:hypothetical protein